MYILDYILHASNPVKIVILILICLSILLLSAFLGKNNKLNLINSYSTQFPKYILESESIVDFYNANQKNLAHPMGLILTNFVQTLQSYNNQKINNNIKNLKLEMSIEKSYIQIKPVLEKYQIFFLSTASIAPLIGLFGTICGIINTFHSISLSGDITMSTIAPGMSEALLTTGVSILIAIIAASMYNFFLYKISNINDSLDLFVNSLHTKLLDSNLKNDNESESDSANIDSRQPDKNEVEISDLDI